MNLNLFDKLIHTNPSKLKWHFIAIIVLGIVGINAILFSIYDLQLFGPKRNIEKTDIMLIGFIFSVVHLALSILTMLLLKKMHNANQLIKKERDEIARIDKAKDEFAAMVAHELRTPLVPIVSYTKMIHQEIFGQLNDVQKEKLRIVLCGTESLLILVQDLLDLHKAELGKLKLNFAFVDVRYMVEEAIAEIQPLADKCGVTIQNCIIKEIKLGVDKKRIIQVLTNIIKNAIDFVPKGNGIIKIQLEVASHYVIFSISDNGCGISKDKIGNMFNKFYQLDTSQTRERGGSGLGLAICKGIVEQHKGKIWVESEVNKGTTIKFSLPLVNTKNIDASTIKSELDAIIN